MEVTKWDIGAAVQLLEDTPDELLSWTLGEVGDTITRLYKRMKHIKDAESARATLPSFGAAVWCPHLGASVQVGEFVSIEKSRGFSYLTNQTQYCTPQTQR